MKVKTTKTIDLAAARFKRRWSVDEFCALHGISRGMFYKLKRAGLGPKTEKAGRRTLVINEGDSA